MNLLDKVLLGALVLIVGVIAAGIAIPSINGPGRSPEKARTRSEMSAVSIALQLYQQEYGYFPQVTDNARLTAVLEGVNPHRISFYSLNHETHPDGILLDGWNRPFLFDKSAQGFRIRSAGKDGIYDTKDDLTRDVARVTVKM